MPDEIVAWIYEYRRLVKAEDWQAVADHVRESINTSKEVLLSSDPKIQRALHFVLTAN